MMCFSNFSTFAFLFDIAPDKPFMFGSTGVAGGIGLGLFLSAIAVAFFLLFRKSLSTTLRAIIAGILIILGVGGGVAIWATTAAYDWTAEAQWREDARRSAEASRRAREEHLKRQQNRNAGNSSPSR